MPPPNEPPTNKPPAVDLREVLQELRGIRFALGAIAGASMGILRVLIERSEHGEPMTPQELAALRLKADRLTAKIDTIGDPVDAAVDSLKDVGTT